MLERRRARQQMKRGGRQRVLVGAAVQRLTHQLLGRRVGYRADRHVRGRQAADVVRPAGDPEVRQQDSLITGFRVGEQDVGRLDVAVQQVALVRIVQRIGDGGDDLGDFRLGHAVGVALAQQARGIGALDVVHRDPDLALVLAAIVHTHDVRMPQRGRDVGLPVEPLPVLAVRRHRCRQHLQRVASRQPRVLRQVDLAHAAGCRAAARWCIPRTSHHRPTAWPNSTRRGYRSSVRCEPSAAREMQISIMPLSRRSLRAIGGNAGFR